MKIGALLWVQQPDWPALRDAAIAADRAGFDSLWISDHLLCPIGSWRNPVYEAWATIASLGALTERATDRKTGGLPPSGDRDGAKRCAPSPCIERYSAGRRHVAHTARLARKIRVSDAMLRAHCAAVGRDPATIERLASKIVPTNGGALNTANGGGLRRFLAPVPNPT